MEARTTALDQKISDIPNIGKQMTAALLLLGISSPAELRTQDQMDLYVRLGRIKGVRQDLCVLDTFMAAIDFCNGAVGQPWWKYTAQRKLLYPDC